MSHEKQLRQKMINVRLTEGELSIVRKKAFQAGLQIAVYIRESALEKTITEVISPQNLAVLKSVTMVGVNLNQITKKLHIHGLTESAEEIDSIIDQLKKIIYGNQR